MVDTPFLGPSYIARSKRLADQTAVNLYAEIVDSKTGKEVGAFYGRPGLDLEFQLGPGPQRGFHTQEDTLYVVSGQDVYQVNYTVAGGWSFSEPGTLATLSGPVYWLDNGTQVAITDGEDAWLLLTEPVGFAEQLTSMYATGNLTGGNNYAVGDEIYLGITGATGTDVLATPSVSVTAVSSGVVTGAKITNSGAFITGLIGPAGTLAQATTSGGGAGFALAHPLFANPQQLASSFGAITGGTGYSLGDTITTEAAAIGGGNFATQWTPAILKVTGVGAGGAVTSASIVQAGYYTGSVAEFINTQLTQETTSGVGTGFALDGPPNFTQAILYPLNLPNPSSNPTVDLSPGPTMYQDGFGLICLQGTQIMIQSNLFDLSIWQPLNFSSVESKPTNLIAGWNLHEQLYLFKEDNCEIWINAGLNGFVFQKLQGVFIETGCAAPASLTLCGESLCWLSKDDQGQAIVRRITEYAPARISTHALEYAIAQYATVDDATGFSFQMEGHLFYVLCFPTGNATWVIDLTDTEKFGVPMWYQWTFFLSGVRSRWLGNCFASFMGLPYVGDKANGNVYQLDLNTFTDAGFLIERERSWRALTKPLPTPARFDSLQIDMATGVQAPTGQPVTGGGILAAGTGYRVGDRIYMGVSAASAGSIAERALMPVVQVLTLSAGGVATFAFANPGLLYGAPTQLANTNLVQQSTSGEGSGFELETLTFGPAVQTTPQVSLTYSDDGGNTWSDERFRGTGAPGAYGTRVKYNRLGTTRKGQGMDRIFKLRQTDPVKTHWLGAAINI